jgi:hypothetical protein
MSASYQIEEIEVVLVITEDDDDDDADDEVVDVVEEKPQCMASDYPSPPPTQRMGNINPKENKGEVGVLNNNNNTPRQCVELTLNEHENLLQQYGGNPRHDPSTRVVDLQEIELKGAGEDVSLLAIDDMAHENRFFQEIERTTSHETAVDLAIQQSTSHARMNKITPVLLDFPMPEFDVRREIAIKVLAGKMVQGYSIMDGQCGACLMPLMCDASGVVVPCFVCRSIRKSYYKSLATQAVENHCLKTDNDQIHPKRVENLVAPKAQEPSNECVSTVKPIESNAIVSQNAEKEVQNDPIVSMFSCGRDDTIINDADGLPKNQVNVENTTSKDILPEPVNEETISIKPQTPLSNRDSPKPVDSISGVEKIVKDSAEIIPTIGNMDPPSNYQSSTTENKKIPIDESTVEDKDNAAVVDEKEVQSHVMESEDLNHVSEIVTKCDSSIDLVRHEIGNRIQNGWTLVDKTCNECTLPLMTNETSMHEVCIQCEMMAPAVNDYDMNDDVLANLEVPVDVESITGTIDASGETDHADVPHDDYKDAVEEFVHYVDEHDNGVTDDPSMTMNIDIAATTEPEDACNELKSTEPHIEKVPMSEPRSIGAIKSTDQNDTEYSQSGKEQPNMLVIDNNDIATNQQKSDLEMAVECKDEYIDIIKSHNPSEDDVIDLQNEDTTESTPDCEADKAQDMESSTHISPDHQVESVIEDCIIDTTEIVDVVEEVKDVDKAESAVPVIDQYITNVNKNANAAKVTEAIDAEKIFLEISESKSHDQPSKAATLGPFHWITSKTTGSSSDKSIKPLDPPASNDPVITDIFSRNCRRMGPPIGNRFRSNKSPEGFHRADVRSCSPVRTLSPDIQPIPSIDERSDRSNTNSSVKRTSEEFEISNAENLNRPQAVEEWDDNKCDGFDNKEYSHDAVVLNPSPSVEINRDFVRLEVPKTLSYNDRDAIVRLIEVATLTDGGQAKVDQSDRAGWRTESPGNSVANMPSPLSSSRSYTNSAKSVSTRSHVSHLSNCNNPPSPERHTVIIDCTSPSNHAPMRAPSPGLSEAPYHKAASDTSSVYSNESSRASRSSRPSSVYSASTGQKSARSNQQGRRRATPETTIRPKKPGLPSYIPGNPTRPSISASRSYQHSFPSESTAFSRTKSKNQFNTTSNQSTGSVKSMPVSNKTTFHQHGNHHIKPTLPSSTSWRERREEEVILIDDAVIDERDNSDIIDGDKLDSLLARIERAKSQLENSDDAISQYRMRDLIVNLTNSAELLQKIEES